MVSHNVPVSISTLWPLADDARSLISDNSLEMQGVYTTQQCRQLAAQELAQPNVQFMVARIDGHPVGCIALVDHLEYGEVKSFFVAKGARGHGVGTALMDALMKTSRDLGLDTLRLETGGKLASAIALYDRYGFETRAPYGAHFENNTSVFMEWHRDTTPQQAKRARTMA